MNFKHTPFARFFFISICALCFFSCNPSHDRFKIIPSTLSGITFVNRLTETKEFNIFNYIYFYNGGGVGVGDFNQDGLSDVYFASNQGSNALYLNLGDFKFLDVTETSGTATKDYWSTGVSIADVNADGRLDIYVSCLGQHSIYNSSNKLFINIGNSPQGVPLFEEQSRIFGLDLSGFSTQSAFFDYDRDGDLDLFLLNHSIHQNGTFGDSNLRAVTHPLSGDKLLQNQSGQFVEVTKESGIYSSAIGYGLGVVISDVNMDGWPDIYVGNDFHENDYLYINQKNGTFIERLEESMPHTSRYTMGVDFADINNDAIPDLMSMDMLPSDPQILKSSQAEEPYDVYNFKLRFGYGHQLTRNALQLNNGNGTFSDIALFSGVAATDWSWSTLLADFDLDGHKDIYITNGIARRSNDLDYINFITKDSIQKTLRNNVSSKELSYINKMPEVKVPNVFYKNQGDSTFLDVTELWSQVTHSFSNGAAYSDFDNDGDLDLVVNNVNEEALVYENTTSQSKTSNHFLQFELLSSTKNTKAVGGRVIIYDEGLIQMQEISPVRGYLSSVDYKLTFGLGNSQDVDSVIVIWPLGKIDKLVGIKTDTLIRLKEDGAQLHITPQPYRKQEAQFSRALIELDYKHVENSFDEFNREYLIPHMFSQEGPAMAVGDVNGDGLDDIFLGGSKLQRGDVFIQNRFNSFVKSKQQELWMDSTYEDVDAILFDCDGDRDRDLFVVSGGNEYFGKSSYLNHRLYLNDGSGGFTQSQSFPEIRMVGSCVLVFDFDFDGDEDLFVGGRVVTKKYGVKPSSFIFENDGNGKFKDITKRIAPQLLNYGFVKKAAMVDVIGDATAELVLAGEWAPISVFELSAGKYRLANSSVLNLNKYSGWWNEVAPCDIDNDGDIDLVCGNMGLNSKLKATPQEPVRMYVYDFDKNGQLDPIISHYMFGKEYPFHTRDEIMKQLPFLKKKYLSYEAFSRATVKNLFGSELDYADQFVAHDFRSGVFVNLNKQGFEFSPLPGAAQWSNINAVAILKNDDEFQDLLVGGNSSSINIQLGKNDAMYGLLISNSRGNLKAVAANHSGIVIKGEIKSIKMIEINGEQYWIVVKKNERVEFWQRN